MSAVVAEAGTTLRRLVRRRTTLVVGGLALVLALYGALIAPAASSRAALSEAGALAALTVLVLAAGIVSDDRAAGRLALAYTHPAPRAAWVLGRWMAVAACGVAVLTVAAALLVAGTGSCDAARTALAWGAGAVFTAALAALTVALSCRVGPTAQVLLVTALLVAGAMPPDVAAQQTLGAGWTAIAGALWTLLPTPWALGRVHAWVWAGGAVPLAAAALPVQVALWLWAGARALERAELGMRDA